MSDNEQQKKKVNTDELIVQNLMKDENGRAYMWKHLQECSVFENIFDSDPIEHAYRAGKRQAGLQLVQDLKDYTPVNYTQMIKENI